MVGYSDGECDSLTAASRSWRARLRSVSRCIMTLHYVIPGMAATVSMLDRLRLRGGTERRWSRAKDGSLPRCTRSRGRTERRWRCRADSRFPDATEIREDVALLQWPDPNLVTTPRVRTRSRSEALGLLQVQAGDNPTNCAV